MALQPTNSEQKVNVFIRVRPLIQREKDADEKVNWYAYADDKIIQQCQPGTRKLVSSTTPYAFDQIFNEAARTENVYEKAVAPIVEKSLQGFNGTVLCYGQTSSGKTHTMYGSEDEPGIIFLTAQDIFRRLGDDSRSYLIRIGLLEVYNEKLTDLLDPQRKHIEIQEKNGEVIPKDLKEIDIYSPEDMLDAARRVQKERRIGETRMNKESSRSHTILRIIVRSRPNDDSEKTQMTQALLNFVDLAGSEKADQTGAVGDRFREATYINKSLTTLSIVVNQLSGLPTPSNWNPNLNSISTLISTAAGTSSAKAPAKQPFISYRDSKLTRILQSSLSGNAYIALICNVTPASIEETHSTLRFASRAKCIKVDPTKNLGAMSASEYKMKILELEKQLNGSSAEADRLRKQLAAFTKFVQPYMNFSNSPAPFNAQPERRRSMCPSMLLARRNNFLDLGPGDEFKIPKSPVRRSLMPTPAANNPPQRSQFDSSFEFNENFLLEEPGPPPAKVAKVDGGNESDSMEAELEKLRSSNERLHSENEILQKNLSDSKSRSQKMMSDFERLQEENLSQTDFINSIEEEVGELKKKLEESEEALSAAKNATVDDEEWCDRYDALRAENDSTVKNLREEKDQLVTRVEELLVQLQVAEEFKANLAEVTELKDDLQQQVVSIGETLKATEFEKIQLEADLATANESLAAANKSLGRLEQLEQQHQALRSNHEALVRNHQVLQTETSQLRQDNRSEHLIFEAQKDELEIKYDKTLELLAIREKELEEKSKASDNKAKQCFITDINGNGELLKMEEDNIDEPSIKVQAEHMNANLTEKLAAVTLEINAAKKERDAARANMTTLESEKEELASKFDTLSTKLFGLESDHKVIQDQLAKSLQSNDNLHSTIDSLKQKLEASSHDFVQELPQQLASVSAELVSLRQQYESTTIQLLTCKELGSDSQAKVDELQFQIQTLQAQVNGEKSGSAILKKTNQQLSERQKTLLSELDELKAHCNSLQSTTEIAKHKRATLEQTVATLEARLAQAEQERPRVSKRSVGCQIGVTEDIVKECRDYRILATQYKYKRDEAVKELTAVKREMEECKKKNAENEKHIADFTARVVADSEMIDSLQDQIRKIPQTVEMEVQCDIAAEVFTKAKKYILFDIPEGWEDFGEIYKRMCHFKSEASALQLEKSKCKCNKDDGGFPGGRFPYPIGPMRPWLEPRSSPTVQPTSSVAQNQATLGPALGRPAVLGKSTAVLPAQVNSVRPNQVNTATPTQLNSAAPAAVAASQATRPPSVPSGVLSTRPLHSTDDAPMISNVSKSAEETLGKANISSGTQTKQPDVVAPVSKLENGENQPPKRRRERINWDEPCPNIEQLQKEMPRKRDF